MAPEARNLAHGRLSPPVTQPRRDQERRPEWASGINFEAHASKCPIDGRQHMREFRRMNNAGDGYLVGADHRSGLSTYNAHMNGICVFEKQALGIGEFTGKPSGHWAFERIAQAPRSAPLGCWTPPPTGGAFSEGHLSLPAVILNPTWHSAPPAPRVPQSL